MSLPSATDLIVIGAALGWHIPMLPRSSDSLPANGPQEPAVYIAMNQLIRAVRGGVNAEGKVSTLQSDGSVKLLDLDALDRLVDLGWVELVGEKEVAVTARGKYWHDRWRKC